MSASMPSGHIDPDTPSFLQTTPKTDQPSRPISWRAMLLAFVLAPITTYWTSDQLVDVIFSLMIPPVMMTLVVAVLNLIVRRVAPRYALTEGELIIFYATHTVMSAICAEWMNVIAPCIYSYGLFASTDTHFRDLINPYAHPAFFIPVKNADQFIDFRNGGYSFTYFLQHLNLWWIYIASWTLLVTLVSLAMLCINSLMRDEWTNRERLAFPIIQLPMAIVQSGSGRSQVWKSKFFFAPFLIMFAIDMLNGFHFIYPNLPLVNMRFLGALNDYTRTAPLNAIGWTPIGIFPYLAVIGFFMPTDLLFSCIFFFFFRKFEQVFTYSLGYTESAGVFGGGGLVPSPPYFSEQSWGAFLALFVTAMWVARNYLKEVWQQILHGNPKGDKGVPHRVAFAGLLLSVAGLGGIGLMIGIPLWMVLFTVVLFLMFSAALTRMRGQIGAPSHEMAFMGPNQMLVDFIGTQALPKAGISRLVSTFFFMNRIHRTHPMPHQLESMKMADNAGLNQRAVFGAVLVATIVGSILGHMYYIYTGYHFGGKSAGGDVADVVSQITSRHQPANPVGILFVVIGFVFVLFLDFVRFRVAGFALHPAGYALAMNFGLDYFWFGLVIVWIIKVFVERYYGLKGHDKMHQVALGIMLAEFCAEAIWSSYAMATHTATYSVSINGRLGWDQ